MRRRTVMVSTFSVVDSTWVLSAAAPRRLAVMPKDRAMRLAQTLVRARREYALTGEAQEE